MTEPKTITIDVQDSQRPKAFPEGRRFFCEELSDALKYIRAHWLEVRAGGYRGGATSPPSVQDYPPITVFGTRGAGKTSFMRALQAEVLGESFEGKIRVLDTLEPNRIETQEIPLVTVAAAILRCVVKVRSSYADMSAEYTLPLKELDRCYQELAGGFGVLVRDQGLAPRDRAESATTFAQRMLDGSDSGLCLRERFRRFVQSAARVCAVDAFLLCIDDVDVAHKRYSDVLETVRKYLDIPELIVVIAADEELLDVHLTACAHEWLGGLVDSDVRAFALGQKLAERNVRRHRTQAYLLKEQYLTKLLPPDHRVYLRPLAIRIRDEKVRVTLRDPATHGRENQEGDELSKCLEPLGKLLGGNWKLAAEYLPSKNRSLVRMTPLLLEWYHQESQQKPKGSATDDGRRDGGEKKKAVLDELVRMCGRAFAAVGVRGWTLRRLEDGEGDGALMRWVLHHAVETPRSFNLEADSSADGDERRLVPALLYARWVEGCRKRERSDAFLSYGLRVVLPAYAVERSRNRQRVADALDYCLRHGTTQTCAVTMGQLIAWEMSQRARITMNRGVEGEPVLGEIEGGASAIYGTRDGKRKSFFMALARIADLCALSSRAISPKDSARVDDAHVAGDLSKRVEEIAKLSGTRDSWKAWLQENQNLKDVSLPARAIGELFAFLYEQCREGIIDRTERAFVLAFLYALGTQELASKLIPDAMIDTFATPERLAGECSRVTDGDLDELFERARAVSALSENNGGVPYLAVWCNCPLFAAHVKPEWLWAVRGAEFIAATR